MLGSASWNASAVHPGIYPRRSMLHLNALVSTFIVSALALGTSSTALAWQGADDCANAQAISGFGPHAFDNTAATATAGLTDCNGVGVRKDVWFLWTASVDARITFEVCGQTSLDTRLAVYVSGTCGNPQQITCGNDGCPGDSMLSWTVDAGEQYLLRLGSRTVGESGTGTFTLRQTIPLFNPVNGSYYEVVQENIAWSQARDRAEALEWKGRPGHLVVYNDAQELDFIVQNGNVGRAWTGLFQDVTNPGYSEPSGGWIWIDGTSAVNPDWIPNEPNNAGATGENFAETFGGSQFNDVVDSHAPTDQYVVEWDAALGTNYCQAVPNSTGQPGLMSVTGSLEVASNNLRLAASNLPAFAFSFFITSPMPGFAAGPGGSSGNLCLGGSIGRYVGPGQIQMASGAGEIELDIDLTLLPTPNGLIAVLPGDTHNFQAWYRDAVMGTATSNFTDGITVLFE